MREYDELGHIQPKHETDENGYYKPHHAVISTTQSYTDLFYTLQNVRKLKYSIIAVVVKMYRQISANPKNRKYQ